jgi:hypothetical protein
MIVDGAWCQSTIDIKLDMMPDTLKKCFIIRLNEYNQHYNNQQWDKVYPLLVSSHRKRFTIEEYSKEQNREAVMAPGAFVLKFTPEYLGNPLDTIVKEWPVEGCTAIKEKGKYKYYGGTLNAYYEENDWYFLGPAIFIPLSKCNPVPNKKKEK